MEFIGREEEFGILEYQYSMKRPFVILKGRRRMGKNRLLEEFLKDNTGRREETREEQERAVRHIGQFPFAMVPFRPPLQEFDFREGERSRRAEPERPFHGCAHVAFVFEDVCREELRRCLLSEGVSAEHGKYWGRAESTSSLWRKRTARPTSRNASSRRNRLA